jgi:hypothetical protein
MLRKSLLIFFIGFLGCIKVIRTDSNARLSNRVNGWQAFSLLFLNFF